MKRIKLFENFILPEDQNLSEDSSYYTSNGYITDPSIKNEDDLMKSITDNIQNAMDEFCKDNDIPLIALKIGDKKISAESTKIDVKDLGIFARALEFADLSFFGGKDIKFGISDDKFFFMPFIWTDLHIGCKSKTGENNMISLPLGDNERSTIYYDIPNKKWYTQNDYVKIRKDF